MPLQVEDLETCYILFHSNLHNSFAISPLPIAHLSSQLTYFVFKRYCKMSWVVIIAVALPMFSNASCCLADFVALSIGDVLFLLSLQVILCLFILIFNFLLSHPKRFNVLISLIEIVQHAITNKQPTKLLPKEEKRIGFNQISSFHQ